MKKTLSTVVLVVGLFSGGNAHAIDAVIDAANIVQTSLTAVKSGLTAASTAIIEAKTTLMEAWDKTVWAQQAKDMIKSIEEIQNTIKKVNEAKETLTKQITGPIEAATGYLDKVENLGKDNPQAGVNYAYAQLLPNEVMTTVTCADGKACETTDSGYKSVSADVASIDLRDSLKVKAEDVGGSFNFLGVSVGSGKSIAQISREAAELNAQELAVIDTMAREAYVQASNRIVAIDMLRESLRKPPADKENTLKYTTDVQAMLVAEQAFLTNDQNRLAALSVLQQSQRDRYEQRKKEIVDYIAYGDRAVKSGAFDPSDPLTFLTDSSYQGLKRVAIAGVTKGAFTALQDQYK